MYSFRVETSLPHRIVLCYEIPINIFPLESLQKGLKGLPLVNKDLSNL